MFVFNFVHLVTWSNFGKWTLFLWKSFILYSEDCEILSENSLIWGMFSNSGESTEQICTWTMCGWKHDNYVVTNSDLMSQAFFLMSTLNFKRFQRWKRSIWSNFQFVTVNHHIYGTFSFMRVWTRMEIIFFLNQLSYDRSLVHIGTKKLNDVLISNMGVWISIRLGLRVIAYYQLYVFLFLFKAKKSMPSLKQSMVLIFSLFWLAKSKLV